MTSSQYVGIAIIAGYWVVLITTRWMFIARPNRRFTLARIDDAQYFLEPDAPPSLLDEARSIAAGTHVYDDLPWLRERRGLDPPDDPDVERFLRRFLRRASDPFIWNGSRDLVAWNLMHRVEADYAGTLTGPALIAAMMKAQSQLEDLPPGKRTYWARVLHDQLDGAPGGRLRDEPVAQAIMRNLLNELYNARDTKFTNLATQQNKVTWLVFTGLVDPGRARQPGLRGPPAGRCRGRHPEPAAARAAGAATCRATTGSPGRCCSCRPSPAPCRPGPGCCSCRRCRSSTCSSCPRCFPTSADLTAPTGAILGVAILFGFSERILDRLVRQAEDEISTNPAAAKKAAAAAQEPPSHPAAAPEAAAPTV